MSLTYGGTTYRSLEEQVRKNMEDISTEADSLAALTDKVDNLKTGGTKVSLTFPAGASSGTVTDEQLATLQKNDENYIEMVNDKELYYLNDPGHEEGFLTYSHVGIENSKATIKTLTITVSAKSFVIVTTVVPTESGGGKLYRHDVTISNLTSGYLNCTIINNIDTEFAVSDLNDLFFKKVISASVDAISMHKTYTVKLITVTSTKISAIYYASYPFSDTGSLSFSQNDSFTDTITEL